MLPAGKVALSSQPLGFSADSVGQTAMWKGLRSGKGNEDRMAYLRFGI